jgi:hypothetical protein
VLTHVPASEIKPRSLRLASLVFGVERLNYAPRGTHLTGRRILQRTELISGLIAPLINNSGRNSRCSSTTLSSPSQVPITDIQAVRNP